MKNIDITITGNTPLLLHRFTDAAQMSASSGSRSSIANDSLSAEEQAEQSLYLDDDGHSGVPGPNVFRSFIDAGTYFKVGKGKVTTQKTSLIPAAVSLSPVFCLFPKGSKWKVDSRPVRMPSTGGRILRHRPCYDRWSLGFTLELDESIIGEKLMREIVDCAGVRIGLGDYRPACKGPFGKFKVVSWIVFD